MPNQKLKTWLTETLLRFCVRFAPQTANGIRMREHITDYFNPPNEDEARSIVVEAFADSPSQLLFNGDGNLGEFITKGNQDDYNFLVNYKANKNHLDQPYNE